jgi:hypothetical protein
MGGADADGYLAGGRGNGPREMCLEALNQYLKLLAGHYAVFKDGQLTIRQYWDLEFPGAKETFPDSEAEIVEDLRERFQTAVRRQMVSDVPLEAFLSAGLDSSSIVAMMSRESTEPVRTYCITFPDKYRKGENTLDDPEVARRVAASFGLPGILMISVLAGIVFWVYDSASRELQPDFAVLAGLYVALFLSNGSLFTTLGSAGLGLLILVLWIMPKSLTGAEPAPEPARAA